MKTIMEVSMRPFLCTAILAAVFSLASARAAENPVLAEQKAALGDNRFQEQLQSFRQQRTDAERLSHARRVLGQHLLSSAQVKSLCSHLGDDNARLELASNAYPHVVDPENFYDVYDAFSSFSRVLRLHDRIQQLHRAPRLPPVVVVQPLTDAEFKDILNAVRQESFDDTRKQMAKQILSSSRGNFLSRQIKELTACFTFDDGRLEIANYAYDYTLDREKYFLVSDAFTFKNNKDSLARYIESRNQAPPPPRR